MGYFTSSCPGHPSIPHVLSVFGIKFQARSKYAKKRRPFFHMGSMCKFPGAETPDVGLQFGAETFGGLVNYDRVNTHPKNPWDGEKWGCQVASCFQGFHARREFLVFQEEGSSMFTQTIF